MLKRSLILCCLLVTALLVSSCLLDPDESKDPPPPTEIIERQDLTEEWHVLNNIEYAYKTRSPDVYDELLNADFTFFFAPGDVDDDIPAQWGRLDEKDATERLFASDTQTGNPPPDPVCRSMRLDLVLPEDKNTISWVDVIPENFPNETWKTATIFYTFTFEIEPNTTFIAQNGAKAQFTVRNTGTVTDPHWELVEFRDLDS